MSCIMVFIVHLITIQLIVHVNVVVFFFLFCKRILTGCAKILDCNKKTIDFKKTIGFS